VALGAAPAVDLQRGGRLSWLRYAAGVEGNWDVTGNGRVVSLGVVTAFVDPLGSEPVPFTELVMLGGNEPFAGYIQGRLRDRSALVAQLGWHWPVFSYLDGLLAVSVGNVFGPHLQDFSLDLLRLSAELGLRARGVGFSGFQFVIGMGTEPFRNFSVSSFRFAFGVSYGP
jgi:outer membrane protein assembly factor BamA